jgi:ABC-type transport system involved in multi-copper enzyme maturation permease subunit
MATIIKLELYKMLRKKMDLLLAFPLLIPLVFGIGLSTNITTAVQTTEGSVDLVSQGVGLFEFTDTMLKSANFVFVFILMILVASLYSKEIEDGQIMLYAVRIGERAKLGWAKFLAIALMQAMYYVLFFVLCFTLYVVAVLVGEAELGAMVFANWKPSLLSASYLFVNGLFFTAISLLIGTRLKAFPCFACTFILSIISLMFQHFGGARLLLPEHFAEYVVHGSIKVEQLVSHMALFVFYVLVFLGSSIFLLRKKDL